MYSPFRNNTTVPGPQARERAFNNRREALGRSSNEAICYCGNQTKRRPCILVCRAPKPTATLSRCSRWWKWGDLVFGIVKVMRGGAWGLRLVHLNGLALVRGKPTRGTAQVATANLALVHQCSDLALSSLQHTHTHPYLATLLTYSKHSSAIKRKIQDSFSPRRSW